MELTVRHPRVLLLIDRWNWAFHTIARAIMDHLSDRFHFTLLCTADRPVIDENAFDIIHVLYEYETSHRPFLRGQAKIVRGVYSHYWQEWNLSTDEFYRRYLSDAHAIAVPSKKLYNLLQHLPPAVSVCPEGVDTLIFHPTGDRSGPFIAGWAGDPTRDIKRFSWAREACEDL